MTDIREVKEKLYALEQDDLSPEEAANARRDLKGLFFYLSVHGFTTPIPSIVRLMEFLDNVAEEYICPECHNAAKEYGYCSHCGEYGKLPKVCETCNGTTLVLNDIGEPADCVDCINGRSPK